MWIDIDNIRTCSITADEYVELCNIMAQCEEMTDKDWDRMPGFKEWYEKALEAIKECKSTKFHDNPESDSTNT